MNSIEKQLNEATKHIALSADEKKLMRERLVEYMEYKPLERPIHTTPLGLHVPRFAFFRAHHFTGALMIAFLVTSSSFGVSMAATSALPGEFLYSVKVNINEGVKTAFLNTDEERINWDRERAELRLAEASQLASEGRLDMELQEEVVRRFAEHTDAMVTRVLAIEEENPVLAIEVSTEFEAALETHEAVLARFLVEHDEDIDEGERELVEQVHIAGIEAGKIREEAEEKLVAEEFEKTEEEQQEEEGVTDEDTVPEEGEEVVSEPSVVLTDSANMRVHAVYRAHVRAEEHLASAEELIAGLDPSSDLAVRSAAQIASGKELMREGDMAVDEYDLGTAYSAYRRAAGMFQKVAQLLEVADLFDIEIYPDVDELPSATGDTPEEAAPTETTADEVVVIDEAAALVARAAADGVIEEAQILLLTHEGYELDLVERVNGLIKDATALVLRGEIALVLGDLDEAHTLFVSGEKQARRAVDLLVIAGKDGGVIHVEEAAPEEPIETEAVEVSDEEPDLTILHQHEEGTHTYTGALLVESGCIEVTVVATVGETVPEEITLELTTATSEDISCEEESVEVTKEFHVEVSASPEAVLSAVYVDGAEYSWELEGATDESEENTNEEQDGGDEPTSLLQRAIESTADFLLPE